MKIKIFLALLFGFFLVGGIYFLSRNSSKRTVSYTGFGAQEVVGGSMHMLNTGESTYLIDSGSFYENGWVNSPLPEGINVNEVDAIFVTHAHADHIGRLPLILAKGYIGPIYMTSVTKDISLASLVNDIKYSDVGNETFYYSKNNKGSKKPVYLERFRYEEYEVLEKNRIFVESKRTELDEKGYYLAESTIEQLKNELEKKLESQIITIDYDRPTSLKGNVSFQFIYTSHLPGSSMVLFSIMDKSILFSGDVGSNNSPFLPSNEPIKKQVDYLFVEGTYGTSPKKINVEEDRKNFREYVGQAINNNQRVIIPAFAIDRTQQVIYEIKKGIDQGQIPQETVVKVFGPTSEKITNLYRNFSNDQAKYGQFFAPIMFTDIFNIPNLIYNPKNTNGSIDTTVNRGQIGIMTPGMPSLTGFSSDAIRKYIEDKNTHFIFVSYQDPGEIGGEIKLKIESGDKYISIGNKEYEIKAKIYNSSGFSGHGNIETIVDMFKATNPQKIFIVHLNKEDGVGLGRKYEEIFKKSEVIIPKFKGKYNLFEIN